MGKHIHIMLGPKVRVVTSDSPDWKEEQHKRDQGGKFTSGGGGGGAAKKAAPAKTSAGGESPSTPKITPKLKGYLSDVFGGEIDAAKDAGNQAAIDTLFSAQSKLNEGKPLSDPELKAARRALKNGIADSPDHVAKELQGLLDKLPAEASNPKLVSAGSNGGGGTTASHPSESAVAAKLKAGLGEATYKSPATGATHVVKHDGKHYRAGMMRSESLAGLLNLIDGKVNNKAPATGVASFSRPTASHPPNLKYGGRTYIQTGKTGSHEKIPGVHAEYEAVDPSGQPTGQRVWRAPSGLVLPD